MVTAVEGKTEYGTFSAAVDQVVVRAGRPDRVADIMSYVRASTREGQTKNKFDRDMIEDQLTANAEPYIWTTPKHFRQMRTVEYPAIVDGRGEPVRPRFRPPGRAQRKDNWYARHEYYRGPTYFVFTGHGGGAPGSATVPINIAYWSYFVPLQYYKPTEEAPARYFIEDEAWTYDPEYDVDDTTREAAQALVTNWMLFDWFDLAVEGGLAKIFKTYNDPRAISSFALFKSYIKDLLNGEARSAAMGET